MCSSKVGSRFLFKEEFEKMLVKKKIKKIKQGIKDTHVAVQQTGSPDRAQWKTGFDRVNGMLNKWGF